MRYTFLLLAFVTAAAAQEAGHPLPFLNNDAGHPLPPVNRVVAQMMQRDKEREAGLRSYTASRRYILENSRHHKRAEMLVTVTCLENGSKQFQTVSATGWSAARNHVFPRLLEGESEASLPGVREASRITPQNYSFEMLGTDTVNQRPTYVIAITPKTQNKYLVQGKIWVDLDEYAILRIEGKPAKSPSFWIKSVQFVHTYRKNGPLWLPETDRSVTDARIVGATELTIEYLDYAANGVTLSASRDIIDGGLR
jgi:hypothetical protein